MIKDIKLELDNVRPTKKKIIGFVIVVAIILGLIDWRSYEFNETTLLILALVFALLFALALSKWSLLIPIFKLWMLLSIIIGWLVLRILLTLTYIVLICPLGIIFRVLGKDSMMRKLDPNATTYWISKVENRDESRYLKKF